MILHKLSDRIYYSAYEEERDRPALGYIKGDSFSVAVDAGHSVEHLNEFYAALEQLSLPLPELTILTHWHWDHTFAMHAVSGLTIASAKTNGHLKQFIAERSQENDRKFLALDPSITREYSDQPLIVVPADIEFSGSLDIDAGGIAVHAFEAVSPHTDDATLVLLPEEKVLFFGDAISGVFPTWIADPAKSEALYETIEKLDLLHCIGGHWDIWDKEQMLKEIRGEYKKQS